MRAATVFNYLLEATLAGSVMIVLMLPVRRFLRSKLTSRLICFAWLLVAVRLLLPISLPNPMMNELRPTGSVNLGFDRRGPGTGARRGCGQGTCFSRRRT